MTVMLMPIKSGVNEMEGHDVRSLLPRRAAFQFSQYGICGGQSGPVMGFCSSAAAVNLPMLRIGLHFAHVT
jgi:hypothetical protein